MTTSGNWLIIQSIILTLLFKVARLIFVTVQQMFWYVNGTAKLVEESRQPENYSRCAHVLDIVMHHQFDILHTFAFEHFICLHNRFENPDYIAANDHISLYTVNDRDAIFVEAQHEGMLLWQSKYTPFIRNSQVQFCRRLIVVPLAAFHRMSEELGDPKGELIFLFNTGRCGATLFTQMMENTGVCVAIAEPDAPNIVARQYRKKGDTKEVRQVMKGVIRWQCRPYKCMKPLAYVLKITSVSTCAMPLLTDLFPKSRVLYIYRDSLKMAQSCYRASKMLPSMGISYILGKFSDKLMAFSFELIGFAGEDYNVKLYDDLTFGILVVVRTAVPYLNMRRQGFNAAAVRYEDIVSDPLFVSRQVLEFCGLPVSLAESAIQTMHIDSQRNSPVSQDLLRRHRNPEPTPDSIKAANSLLQKNGLPLIGEECLLDGTISKKP